VHAVLERVGASDDGGLGAVWMLAVHGNSTAGGMDPVDDLRNDVRWDVFEVANMSLSGSRSRRSRAP
jgi:hypothetical protein